MSTPMDEAIARHWPYLPLFISAFNETGDDDEQDDLEGESDS